MNKEDINKCISLLPKHWEVYSEEEGFDFWDAGRDYDKPMFIRKDRMARIYFNELSCPNDDAIFAICWDGFGQGDCSSNFKIALKRADELIKREQNKAFT